MKKGNITIVLLIIAIVILVAFGAYFIGKKQAEAPTVDDTTDTGVQTDIKDDPTEPIVDNTVEVPKITKVDVPVFSEGGNIVCGAKMTYVTKTVAPTTAPLNAAYKALFAMSDPYVENGVSYQNPIGYQTKKTEFPKLKFVRADLVGSVASVYLEGSITGVGTCYDPLPKIQLDAVAKHYPAIKTVKYYLNGRQTDPGCIANQQDDAPVCYTGVN